MKPTNSIKYFEARKFDQIFKIDKTWLTRQFKKAQKVLNRFVLKQCIGNIDQGWVKILLNDFTKR